MKILITYNLAEEDLQRIKNAFPAVQVTKTLDRDEIMRSIVDDEILLAGRFDQEIFARAKKLRWFQSITAGVERFLSTELVNSRVILTNARDIHAK